MSGTLTVERPIAAGAAATALDALDLIGRPVPAPLANRDGLTSRTR